MSEYIKDKCKQRSEPVGGVSLKCAMTCNLCCSAQAWTLSVKASRRAHLDFWRGGTICHGWHHTAHQQVSVTLTCWSTFPRCIRMSFRLGKCSWIGLEAKQDDQNWRDLNDPRTMEQTARLLAMHGGFLLMFSPPESWWGSELLRRIEHIRKASLRRWPAAWTSHALPTWWEKKRREHGRRTSPNPTWTTDRLWVWLSSRKNNYGWKSLDWKREEKQWSLLHNNGLGRSPPAEDPRLSQAKLLLGQSVITPEHSRHPVLEHLTHVCIYLPTGLTRISILLKPSWVKGVKSAVEIQWGSVVWLSNHLKTDLHNHF